MRTELAGRFLPSPRPVGAFGGVNGATDTWSPKLLVTTSERMRHNNPTLTSSGTTYQSLP
jgi:hypothetical protein